MKSERIIKNIQRGVFGLSLVTALSAIMRIGSQIVPYTVETDEATFILLMGTHGIGSFGQEATLPKGLRRVDAVFLESGNFQYMSYDTREFVLPESRFVEMAFYRKLIPELRRKNIPILFGDLPMPRAASLVAVLAQGFISFSTILAGVTMALADNSKNTSWKKRSAGVLVGAWGAAELLKHGLATIPEISREAQNKHLRKSAFVIELSHPENIIVMLRNALISEKLLFYAEEFQKKQGRKPTIVIVMGAGHEFISEYLARGRKFCTKILQIYPHKLYKALFGEYYASYIFSLAEVKMHATGSQSTILKDPFLQKDS